LLHCQHMEACLQVDARWSVKRHSEQHEQALLEPCLSYQKKPWLILWCTLRLTWTLVGLEPMETRASAPSMTWRMARSCMPVKEEAQYILRALSSAAMAQEHVQEWLN